MGVYGDIINFELIYYVYNSLLCNFVKDYSSFWVGLLRKLKCSSNFICAANLA